MTFKHAIRGAFVAAGICSGSILPAQDGDVVELDPVVVNANRLVATSASLSPEVALRDPLNSPQAFTDDIASKLETYPGFATFRATDPRAAHPTTQGVRLRNLGANATSRALVLYDGAPQNDPFGGWVYWHQYNLANIESVSLNPTAGGEVWGNYGAGGVISLVSRNPLPPAGIVALSLGTSDTYELSASAAQALGNEVTLEVGGRLYQTDGFHTLDASQRGSVDRRAYSDSEAFSSRLRWAPNEDWRVQFSAQHFDEERGNGTPLAVNDTQALNLSFLAERQLDSQGSRLNLVAYHQKRDFRNVFTSVSDDRNSERPALDQYDVPAKASGAAVVYRLVSSDDDHLLLGVDARVIEGSVNELYRNLGDGFTRERYAGGEQRFMGAFATMSKAITDSDVASLTLRVERIENLDGQRIETDTENDVQLSNDRYSDRSDDEISASLKWRHEFSDTLESYATVFSGFRAPTLNELYRPFRVRNDITEANPLLANERQDGVEVALIYEQLPQWRLRLAAFHYRLRDVITNALLTTDSGFDPRFGFIPEGGSGSLRENLDRSRVSGFELQSEVDLTEALRLDFNLVFAESEVRRDAALPQFNGRQFPQSAPFRANLGLQWQAATDLSIWSRLTWFDQRYENLENSVTLADSTRVSLGASYQVTTNQSLALVVENLFDERTISGISNDGLVTIDAPREARVVWTWRY